MKPELLPEMSWDFEWGTNMQHALLLARKQLARQSGTKQIIMVTDGEPTAHIEGGEAVLPVPAVADHDRGDAARRCSAARVTASASTPSCSTRAPTSSDFVERMMKMNGGRAFFTNADTLGDYVLVDFLDHRRQQQRRAG